MTSPRHPSGWLRATVVRTTADAPWVGAASRPPFYQFPDDASLRRSWAWQQHPLAGESLERVAFHEAGHVVLLGWLGVTEVHARAQPHRGEVNVLSALPQMDPDNAPLERPDLAATAAAIFHAGTCAELLAAGQPWTGPVLRLQQTDHQRAEAMLCQVFGAHASGAHAYAQMAALHVLSHRWELVCGVASVLAREGRFRGGPASYESEPPREAAAES